MRASILSTFALWPLLTTLTLSNPTSPRHVLSSRTYFPGCINATTAIGESAPCTCECESGYVTHSNAPNEVGQYVGCERMSDSAYYSPVGCLSCFQNTAIVGELDCLGPDCAFDWTGGTPNGCFCWSCTNECVVSAFFSMLDQISRFL